MIAASEKKMSETPAWWAAIFITVAIIGLHIFSHFHAGGFCGDEVSLINLACSSSPAFMARDSFPILMPLLVKGWTALGLAGSDLKLRIMGTLIGLGIPGALWLTSWTARRTPPLIGLTLLGLNGTAIFWEVYLRAYGVGTFLLLLTLATMCFLLVNPTWGRTALLSVMAALSVQALYQNAIFFASIGVGGWMVCWLRKDKVTALKILTAALVGVLSLLPYWGSVLSWQKAAAIIRPGFSAGAAVNNFQSVAAFPLPQYVWVWVILGLSVIGLGLARLVRRPAQSYRLHGCLTPVELQVFAGTILLGAVVGYWIFLRFAALITSPWYFLPLLAVAVSCFDLGLPWTTVPSKFRAAFWGVLMATVGIAIVFAARDLNCRFTNADLVAKRLLKEISPKDYVVVTPWYLGISFNRYYEGSADWDTLPPLADHTTYCFDLVPKAGEMTRASQPVLDRIACTLRSGHCVWVVGWMSVPSPGRRASTEAGRFIAEHSQSFESIDLKIIGQTSDYENESMLRAIGWKHSSP